MFRSATIAVVEAAVRAYRMSMQDGRTAGRRRGSLLLCFMLVAWNREKSRQNRQKIHACHAADNRLSQLQEAS